MIGKLGSAPVGRYRIAAVAAMTGVSAPTLRAWERRYHIPQPQRTASAYRLYTDADVEQIRRMRDLCSAGHSAAEAAQVIHHASGALVEVVQDPASGLRNALIDAVRNFDHTALAEAMRPLWNIGPASTIYEQVVGPVLRETGDLWEKGEISIAQEHMLSNAMETLMRALLQLVQPVDATRTAILGCFAEETHSIGLYGVGVRLAGWGFRVINLGPRLPPQAVGDAIAAIRPDLVGLSCVVRSEGDDNELCQAYATACNGTPWIVGGASSECIRPAVEAHGGAVAGNSLEDVRSRLTRLLRPTKSSS